MATMAEVLGNLENGKIKFPQCPECRLDEKQLFDRDGGKTFLIMVEGQFMCGKCAMDVLTPKQCKCGILYKGKPNFCKNCGSSLEDRK